VLCELVVASDECVFPRQVVGPWSTTADSLRAQLEHELTQTLLQRQQLLASSNSHPAGERTRSAKEAPLFTTLMTQLSGSAGMPVPSPRRAMDADMDPNVQELGIGSDGGVYDTAMGGQAVREATSGEHSVPFGSADDAPTEVKWSAEARLWLESELEAAMRFANTDILTGYLFDPRFTFSFDKGLLLLSQSTIDQLNVTVVSLSIPR
jgi:hypothetical protein